MNNSTLRCSSRRCGSSQTSASLKPRTMGKASTIKAVSTAPQSAPAKPQTRARPSITTPINGKFRVRGSKLSNHGRPTSNSSTSGQGGNWRKAAGTCSSPLPSPADDCSQPRLRNQGLR
ncbi:hypothetical protein D9M68_967700 [compost metagenome]